MKLIKKLAWIEKGTGPIDPDTKERKDRFHEVGVMFKRESGTVVAKVDTIPVGFNGWLEILPIKEKEAVEA